MNVNARSLIKLVEDRARLEDAEYVLSSEDVEQLPTGLLGALEALPGILAFFEGIVTVLADGHGILPCLRQTAPVDGASNLCRGLQAVRGGSVRRAVSVRPHRVALLAVPTLPMREAAVVVVYGWVSTELSKVRRARVCCGVLASMLSVCRVSLRRVGNMGRLQCGVADRLQLEMLRDGVLLSGFL